MERVRIADLKAHLSEHLRRVRAGASVLVLDRNTPIARIAPIRTDGAPLVVRPATRRLGSVPLLPSVSLPEGALDLALREERQSWR